MPPGKFLRGLRTRVTDTDTNVVFMRIIYPVSEPITTSKARFIQIMNTCHALASLGCEVDIITGCLSESTGDILKRFNLEPVQRLRVHKVPMMRAGHGGRVRISWGLIFNVSCLLKILGLVKKKAYTCIYLRHLKLAAFLLRFKKRIGVPLVFEAHELFSVTSKKKKMRRLEALVYSGFDRIVTNTETIKILIEKTFSVGSDRIHVVRNGVSREIIASFRGKEPRTNGKILYVGQLYRWKGVECLIESMAFIENALLDVVGGSEESIGRLQELASRKGVLDRVFFHGQVPYHNVKLFLNDGHVAVLPLKSSPDASFTCPLKLFEYMAAKMAIVASDMPVIREVLRDGYNSILVKPDDPKSLAQGIMRLLGNRALSVRIAEQAFLDVSNFTWQNRAEKIEDILKGLSSVNHHSSP